MTAQGEDILAWLDRAIRYREETARAVGFDCFGIHTWSWGSTHLVEVHGAQRFVGAELDEELLKHVVLNDPESILRRCAADRKVLELHRPQQDGSGFPDSMQCRTCSQDGGDGYQYLVPAPCPTVLAIAEGYGWTGGER